MRPADAAKRVGMTEAELRSVNAIPPRVVIRAGSTLLVPRANHIQADVTVKVADTGQVSVSPEVVLRRTVVKAGKGESVATIARKYRASPAQVAQWNKVSSSASFKPGQAVVLFLAPSAPAKAGTSTSARRQPVRRANPKKR
jgi:membrane-bound lytic murein transglycosylase D